MGSSKFFAAHFRSIKNELSKLISGYYFIIIEVKSFYDSSNFFLACKEAVTSKES